MATHIQLLSRLGTVNVLRVYVYVHLSLRHVGYSYMVMGVNWTSSASFSNIPSSLFLHKGARGYTFLGCSYKQLYAVVPFHTGTAPPPHPYMGRVTTLKSCVDARIRSTLQTVPCQIISQKQFAGILYLSHPTIPFWY